MKDLFFGENRFVMNNVSREDSFKQAVQKVRRESRAYDERELAEIYRQGDQEVKEAYLEERGVTLGSPEVVQEWHDLAMELGDRIGVDLTQDPPWPVVPAAGPAAAGPAEAVPAGAAAEAVPAEAAPTAPKKYVYKIADNGNLIVEETGAGVVAPKLYEIVKPAEMVLSVDASGVVNVVSGGKSGKLKFNNGNFETEADPDPGKNLWALYELSLEGNKLTIKAKPVAEPDPQAGAKPDEAPAAAAGSGGAETMTVAALIAALVPAGLSLDQLGDLFKVKEEGLKTIDGTFGDGSGTIDLTWLDSEESHVFKRVQGKYEEIFKANNEKAKVFASLLKVSEEDAAKGLAIIYTKNVMAKMKTDLAAYPAYFDAAPSKAEDKKITGYVLNIISQAADGFAVTYKPDEAWTKYKQFHPDAAPGTPQLTSTQAEIATKMQETWVGKFLGFMGYDQVGKDGLTGFQRIAAGKDFFGIFLLGLFGYKDFAPGYDALVRSLPKSLQDPIRSLEKSNLVANAGKAMENLTAKLSEIEKAVNAESLSGDDFGARLATPEKKFLLGDKAFKLSSKYDIPNTKVLKVTVPKGGRLVIPKSSDLSELGSQVSYEKTGEKEGLYDYTHSGEEPKIYQFEGVLPADLIVSGNKDIKFEILDKAEPIPEKPATAVAKPAEGATAAPAPAPAPAPVTAAPAPAPQA